MCRYCSGKGNYTIIPSTVYRTCYGDTDFIKMTMEEREAFLDKFRQLVICPKAHRKAIKESLKHANEHKQEPNQGSDIRTEDSLATDRGVQEGVQTLPE